MGPLRVRAIISPAQALGQLRLGEGTEQLPAPSLSPGPDAQPATPSSCPGPALSLPLVPSLEPEGMKLEDLDPEEE